MPEQAPTLQTLMKEGELQSLSRILSAGIRSTDNGKYRHWDELRRLTPPAGLSVREWWLGAKIARSQVLRPLPLTDSDGQPFQYAVPDAAAEMIHHIDQDASGQISVPELVVNPHTRTQYLIRSLIEESITSSQLEGASTTHRVAKEMLRTGRPPRTRDEQMILNNYRAMLHVGSWRGTPLEPAMVLDLHRIVTEGTLDDPDAAGRLQEPTEERVVVQSRDDGTVVHIPPPADQLPERLEKMCAFANGGLTDGFVHPVVRAILLHFWLAYDHPFEDGNGRTARALFYWSMSSQDYWLTEYLSISRILNNAPRKYARSFLYTETDERDTTYFLLYQLEVIRRAIADLHAYLRRKMAEVREVEALLRNTSLNHRQIALLTHAVRNPQSSYTYKGHAQSHRVVRQSARTDLLGLEALGLLQRRRRRGRELEFLPAPNLEDRLQEMSAQPEPAGTRP
jgi:Fic family protein